MSGVGGKQHNRILKETVEELRELGYNAIITQNISPDGIVVINDKIIAIEVLAKPSDKQIINKKERYSMFDDIIFRTFKREPIKLDEIEKQRIEAEKKAKDIVDSFLPELIKNTKIKDGVVNFK